MRRKIKVIIILIKQGNIGMNVMKLVKVVILMVQKIDKDVMHVKMDIIMFTILKIIIIIVN